MNSTANISQTEFEWVSVAASIIDNYLIRITGGIGVLINLFFAILLFRKNSSNKHSIYSFFWCRTIFNLIVCVLTAGYISNCTSCLNDSYWLAFYRWFVITINLRVSLLATFICDLFLVFNRFCQIKKSFLFFTKMSKKLNFFICFILSVGVSIPSYAGKIIVKTDNNMYILENTEIGKSRIFFIYYFGLFLLETVIPLSIQLILSVVSVLKFKKVMNRHGHLTRNLTEAKKAEIRFTKAVFSFSLITFVSRVFDLISSIFNRLNIINPPLFSAQNLKLIYFFKALTNLILFLVHAFDGIKKFNFQNDWDF